MDPGRGFRNLPTDILLIKRIRIAFSHGVLVSIPCGKSEYTLTCLSVPKQGFCAKYLLIHICLDSFLPFFPLFVVLFYLFEMSRCRQQVVSLGHGTGLKKKKITAVIHFEPSKNMFTILLPGLFVCLQTQI